MQRPYVYDSCMLFHSLEYLFFFLPVSVAGFFVLQRFWSDRAALVWFIGASLFFYAWWNIAGLWLLGSSIAVNYALGTLLARGKKYRKPIVIAGIAFNLLLLGYFKYAGFFVDTVNGAFGSSWSVGNIILPLAISFFTFEQICWLVELYQRKVEHPGFLRYCAFITNFPKLIAGPVIRPHELLPQITDSHARRFRAEHISVGLTIFVLGLTKKVVLADTMAPIVNSVFHASAGGAHVSFLEAWGATLAYTLQIYFDFSGYTDMAIGSARMFGFTLPLNFASPYKATNISDFWGRWHMSLTRMLREYVYFPLGGNRVAQWKRIRNVMATFLLSGLWHGAGWTFVLWGGIHGIYLVIHQAWRSFRKTGKDAVGSWWGRTLGWTVTFIAVMTGWVFFRSENVGAALRMLKTMAGFDGIALPGMAQSTLSSLSTLGVHFDLEHVLVLTPGDWIHVLPWMVLLLVIALLFPNTQQFLRNFRPALDASATETPKGLARVLVWKPVVMYSFVLSALLMLSLVFLLLSQQTEFLYFRF